MNTFMGMRIVTSLAMTRTEEDWSRVRSRARAERRMRRGPRFRQNVRTVEVPRNDVLVVGDRCIMHPIVEKLLEQAIDDLCAFPKRTEEELRRTTPVLGPLDEAVLRKYCAVIKDPGA